MVQEYSMAISALITALQDLPSNAGKRTLLVLAFQVSSPYHSD